MTIIERIHAAAEIAASSYEGFRRDTLTLTWEERRQGHGKRRSDGGLEFAVSLPAGTIVKAGDYLVLEQERTIVAVQEAREKVYVVRPKTAHDWAYYSYHVGNRHQQVMIAETELVFLQNPAVRSLLEQLHVQFEADERPFTAALANVGH
jgi:urease accessory protein UreE